MPDDWKKVNGDFTGLNMTICPYIHRKVRPHPLCVPEDGKADLVLLPSSGRCNSLKYNIAFEDGELFGKDG